MGRDLARVHANRIHQLSAVRKHKLECLRDAIHHNVNENPGLRGLPIQDPLAADLTHCIVKCCTPVAALAHAPSKHALIEVCGFLDIPCRNLEVANFSVSQSRRHASV